MPAPEARDETITAAVLAELAKIGNAPSSDWLTSPPDATEGSPGDSIPADVPLQLYLEHLATDENDAQADRSSHARIWRGRVWIFALRTAHEASRGRKTVRQAAADAVRALQAAESTFYALTNEQGIQCHGFTTQIEMSPAGFAAGALDLSVHYKQEHGAP